MDWQYTPYIVPLILAGIVSTSLSALMWYRQPGSGSKPFTVLMLAVTTWAWANALELSSSSLSLQMIFIRIEYFGITVVPVAWFLVVIQQTGLGRWMTWRNTGLLMVLPAVTILMAWTNEWHGLIWSSLAQTQAGGILIFDSPHGAWFWVHLAYSYILLLSGTWLLARTLMRSTSLYRMQAITVLASTLPPWAVNAMFLTGALPSNGLNPTPFAFVLTGLIIAWGMFRFRLMDVAPVARDAIIEGMKDGVIVLDRKRRILDINPAAHRVIGYEFLDPVGMPADVLFSGHPELLGVCRDETRSAVEISVTLDQETLYYDIQISRLYDRQSKSVGQTIVLRDITKRRHVEMALRESEERYRAITQAAFDAIITVDSTGSILFVNDAAERIFGYRPEEMSGMNIAALVPEGDRETHLGAFQHYVNTGESLPPLDSGKFIGLSKDGREIPLEISFGEFKKDGQTILTGIVRDVAERQRSEEAIRKIEADKQQSERKHLEEQLQQAQRMEGVGRLTGGVAHDFNNLITGILGYTQLCLIALPEENEKVRRDLEEIQKTAHRASSLTHQLLAFSRRQTSEPHVFCINDVIMDMDRMLRRLIGEDVDLLTRTFPDLGNIEADPGKIEQVIVNMVVNARDAMPNGGTIIIKTSSATPDSDENLLQLKDTAKEYVLLSISDTGVGMSREVQEQVFEAFYTTKGKGKGTGLGLSTCREIVLESGGYINLASEQGHGATFNIYLPAVQAAGTTPDDVFPDGAGAGTETILLVEDEALVREVAAQMLGDQGYHVIEAEGGTEALELALNHSQDHIDLLLTDIVMPVMGGKELSAHFRMVHPETKVLFTSGYTDEILESHGVDYTKVAFLAKPFTSDSLAQCVRGVLDAPFNEADLSELIESPY